MTRSRANLNHLWFLAPALVIYALFILYPFLNTFWLSMHRWDGFSEPVWVGLANYYERTEAGEVRGVALVDV